MASFDRDDFLNRRQNLSVVRENEPQREREKNLDIPVRPGDILLIKRNGKTEVVMLEEERENAIVVKGANKEISTITQQQVNNKEVQIERYSGTELKLHNIVYWPFDENDDLSVEKCEVVQQFDDGKVVLFSQTGKSVTLQSKIAGSELSNREVRTDIEAIKEKFFKRVEEPQNIEDSLAYKEHISNISNLGPNATVHAIVPSWNTLTGERGVDVVVACRFKGFDKNNHKVTLERLDEAVDKTIELSPAEVILPERVLPEQSRVKHITNATNPLAFVA